MSTQVGLLKGDGIGPEISEAVVEIFKSAKAPIEWVEVPSGEEAYARENSHMPVSSIEKIRALKVALKGPTGTPIGKGHKSANVTLRRSLDLYSNVRPSLSIPAIESNFKNIDILTIRENTEDVYSAIEHQVAPGVMQCLKIITAQGSERIIRYAFEMARSHKRKKIHCIHKANIMKMTDGMFLEIFKKVATEYPEIESKDIIVDNVCMQLVMRPQQFDMFVTENLYGDIISDLCAGLIGGLGVAAGANIGSKAAVFEAVHGTAPDIAGKGLANPTALLLSAVMMLEHLKMFDIGDRIRKALFAVLSDGKTLTGDLKGKATTKEFAAAICQKLV